MREIDPPIWRRILVPDDFTLHRLHRVLQIVFSRLDYHLYAFERGERRFEAPDPEAEYETENSTAIRPGWSPRLLDGARAAPPEDAGGPEGFAEMLEPFGDPDHPEHNAYRQWAGTGYDPDRFDAWSLDHALALIVAWGGI